MSIRDRIETALSCLMHFPHNTWQFAENYKTYVRLLNIWHERYYIKDEHNYGKD